MLHDINTWRTVTLSVAALFQTLFVLFYATMPWWKTYLGRALFYKALMLGVIVDFVLASRIWDFGGEDAVFVILYGALASGITWQFLAFIRVKRDAARDHEALS